VAIGGGCPVCSEECLDNIFVLKRNICQLESTTATNYDTNITSLAWCKINSCAYLLAGTESENICDNLKEIILYKAAFCNPVEPTPFICQR